MSEDTRNLENDVDAMLHDLAGAIDRFAEPNAAVLARVKSAVRHEVNEQWLAEYGTPLPSDEAIHLTRRVVRSQLTRTRLSDRFLARSRSRALAGLAAAAMLAVSVGLIRYIGYLNPARSIRTVQNVVETRVDVDLFVEAAQFALADDDFAESVLDELRSIDDSIADSLHDRDSQAVADELDGAVREILESAAPADDTMGSSGHRPEVLG